MWINGFNGFNSVWWHAYVVPISAIPLLRIGLKMLSEERVSKIISIIHWAYRLYWFKLYYIGTQYLVLFWGTGISQKITSCSRDSNPRLSALQANTSQPVGHGRKVFACGAWVRIPSVFGVVLVPQNNTKKYMQT